MVGKGFSSSWCKQWSGECKFTRLCFNQIIEIKTPIRFGKLKHKALGVLQVYPLMRTFYQYFPPNVYCNVCPHCRKNKIQSYCTWAVSENQGLKSLSTKLNSSLNFIFHAPLSDKQIISKQIMLTRGEFSILINRIGKYEIIIQKGSAIDTDRNFILRHPFY